MLMALMEAHLRCWPLFSIAVNAVRVPAKRVLDVSVRHGYSQGLGVKQRLRQSVGG